jgi:hypothetical protein
VHSASTSKGVLSLSVLLSAEAVSGCYFCSVRLCSSAHSLTLHESRPLVARCIPDYHASPAETLNPWELSRAFCCRSKPASGGYPVCFCSVHFMRYLLPFHLLAIAASTTALNQEKWSTVTCAATCGMLCCSLHTAVWLEHCAQHIGFFCTVLSKWQAYCLSCCSVSACQHATEWHCNIAQQGLSVITVT